MPQHRLLGGLLRGGDYLDPMALLRRARAVLLPFWADAKGAARPAWQCGAQWRRSRPGRNMALLRPCVFDIASS